MFIYPHSTGISCIFLFFLAGFIILPIFCNYSWYKFIFVHNLYLPSRSSRPCSRSNSESALISNFSKLKFSNSLSESELSISFKLDFLFIFKHFFMSDVTSVLSSFPSAKCFWAPVNLTRPLSPQADDQDAFIYLSWAGMTFRYFISCTGTRRGNLGLILFVF